MGLVTGLAGMSNNSLFKGYSGHCHWDGKIKAKGQRLPPSASLIPKPQMHVN